MMIELSFFIYRKPTNLGRYLNFHSNHPMEHKRDVIISLFDKILILSDLEFHTKDVEDIINILLQNSYPVHFIFSTINSKINNYSSDNHLIK